LRPIRGLSCYFTRRYFAFFVILFAFLRAGKGLTSLATFSESQHSRYLPELLAVDHYEMPATDGYDGQYYAQLAMHPALRDGQLTNAVDNLPYRARRMLFCWIPYLLALGDPSLALQLYAVQNVVFWVFACDAAHAVVPSCRSLEFFSVDIDALFVWFVL